MITITKERLRERASEKVKGLEFAVTQSAFADTRAELEEELELARIALAWLEAEPVGEFYHEARWGWYEISEGDKVPERARIPLYTAPPAPVDNTFIPKNLDKALGVVGVALPESKEEFNFQIERWIQRLIDRVIRYADEFKEQPAPVVSEEFNLAIENLKQRLVECNRYNYCSDAVKRIEDSCRAAMFQGAEPVSNRDELPGLIEGMEVSVDVSTCDADAGHRYFGTVTEVSELDTAKHGLILLVQDAKPNFKPAGNSPATPDGWIKCSERMPEETKMLLTYSRGEIVPAYWNYVSSPVDGKKYRAFTYLSGIELDGVTHWMPLPSAPQQGAQCE